MVPEVFRLIEVAGSIGLHRGWFETRSEAYAAKARFEARDPSGEFAVLRYDAVDLTKIN